MPTLPLVGDEFAAYRLRAVIGRGGTSVVFQAENPRLGNVVALKDVTSVTFRTYPSLTALYQAYVTKVKSLNSGHFQANFGNCSTRLSYGEVSWNHQFQHPRIFSIKQSASGMLNKGTQPAGRVFCTITNAYNLV